MNADEVEAYFTRSEGAYKFARWARPLAPIVFGVDDATLPVVKGAVQAVAVSPSAAVELTMNPSVPMEQRHQVSAVLTTIFKK